MENMKKKGKRKALREPAPVQRGVVGGCREKEENMKKGGSATGAQAPWTRQVATRRKEEEMDYTVSGWGGRGESAGDTKRRGMER